MAEQESQSNLTNEDPTGMIESAAAHAQLVTNLRAGEGIDNQGASIAVRMNLVLDDPNLAAKMSGHSPKNSRSVS